MASLDWRIHRIREVFFSRFEIWGYPRLSPDPFISVDDSTPFIETYLNEFKKKANDVVKIDSKRKSSYYLNCISLRSDDGVIDRYLNDSSYHCFSELVGCWASGEHKEELVRLSWELLTQAYKLPRDKIYIRYFAGNEESCPYPDEESFDLWNKYVAKERILPSSSEEDFWKAGETGPCGPVVEILFDPSDSKGNPTSVANSNDNNLIEIWRFVFVQFDMDQDGILRPLDMRHMIAGMNVENIASILQGKTSHYNLDAFANALSVIKYGAGDGVPNYSGKSGDADILRVDTAYRVITDHLRMVSAATSYCAQYGLKAEDREDLLKHADRHAMVFGHRTLHTKLAVYHVIVNTILRMSDFHPKQSDAKIASIVEDEVKIYQKLQEQDMQGYVGWNPAVIHSFIQPSLPLRKKENKKKKNKSGKPQRPWWPPRLPPASAENEDNLLDEIDVPETNTGGPEMESSSPKSTALVHSTGVVYHMRQIDFLGHSTYLIFQDENGPCPLISICNCLLLKGKINFEPHLTEVPMKLLVHIVQDLVKGCLKIKGSYSFAEEQILDIVPTLAQGLDIDVKFNRIDGFTATPGTMLFDCLEIPLFHGWLPDEEEMAGASAHSFETLTWAVRESHFPNVETVKKFLNGPQLTAYGLACLYDGITENVPSVHYWNKHFSTIIKYNEELYTLVTDAGYLESSVVWQTLNDINGAGSYMGSDFTPIDLELGATLSGRGISAPLGSASGIYFKSAPKRHMMSLKEFTLQQGNEFSVKRTLFPAGTSLDVAATTTTGRIIALDILRDLIKAHSTNHSYNGAFGSSSIYVRHNGRPVICAPFCGKCTDATKSKDFETYISDILEIFRIDKVGLPALFSHLTYLLRRPSSFIHPRFFWDCAITTLALRPPLTRAGFFQGLNRIRLLAPKEVHNSLKSVLRPAQPVDWRETILKHSHPVLIEVLQHDSKKPVKSPQNKPGIPENEPGKSPENEPGKSPQNEPGKSPENEPGKSLDQKKYGFYTRSLFSLSIFPRQVNEHAKRKVEGVKVEASEQVEEGEEPGDKVECSKQVVEEGEEPGSKQVEEGEELIELLSDLDLLYSHYLDLDLPNVLETLLTSPDMTPELWKWVKEVLKEYDKPEAMEPAPWDR